MMHTPHIVFWRTISGILLCFLVAIPLLSSAQSTSTAPTTTPSEPAADTATSEPTTTEATDTDAALTERTQTRIRNLAANVSNRMDAAIARLEQISQRTASRIDILSDRGIDTTQARELLADAQSDLAVARSTIAPIDENVATFVGSRQPITEWHRIRQQFTDTRSSIVGAHETLQTVVETLRQAIAGAPATNATSTTSTSSTD